MNLEEIEKIIEKHPGMGYEELKKYAIGAGISFADFDNAWDQYLMQTKQEEPKKRWSKIYFISLSILSILGLEMGFWRILLRPENETLTQNIGLLGLLSVSALAMHLSSRFAGSKTLIPKSLQLSIFLFLIAIGASAAIRNATALTAIFYSFGGVILGSISFFAIMRTYKVRFTRTLLIILLTAILMTITIGISMGFEQFTNYYTPTQNLDVDTLELESAVDIANE